MIKQDNLLISSLRLGHAYGVGPVLYRKLVRHFGSPDAVLDAPQRELEALADIGPKTVREILKAKSDSWAEEEYERIFKREYKVLTLDDPNYPPGLLKTYDPPPHLYVHGELQPADAVAVAVVGTRRMTHYGRKQAEELSAGLAAAGLTVVSGLARGIDTFAHQGALSVDTGRTIGVMGNGLGVIYPPENKKLYEQIIERGGAVLSEVPIDTQPEARYFPRRNRIVGGMTLGTLVIEGDVKSGALITARLAVDMDREVFALPGPINSPTSKGPHHLIKSGAKLVESVGDILEELRPIVDPLIKPESLDKPFGKPNPKKKVNTIKSDRKLFPHEASEKQKDARPTESDLRVAAPGSLSERERKIFLLLDLAEPRSIDELIKESGFPAQEVLGILLVLEIRKLCRQLPGKQFLKEH